MIGSIEQLVVAYFADELDQHVGTLHPTDRTLGWVRFTLIDDLAVDPDSEHLLVSRIQADCYAGVDNDQAVPDLTSRQLREVAPGLVGVHDQGDDRLVVTAVRTSGRLRLPDQDMRPARERYIATLAIWAHD